MKKDFDRILLFPILIVAVLVCIGFIMLFWPQAVIGILLPLLGGILIFIGTILIAHSYTLHKMMQDPGFKVVQGIVSLAVGLVFILKQDISLAFLTIIFGLYVLVSGAIHLSMAWQRRRAGNPWLSSLAESLFQFLLGGLLLFGTYSNNMLWVRLLGLEFLVMSGSTLYWLLNFKQMGDDMFK